LRRSVRCRGAIVRDGKILLVKHWNRQTGNVYWWFPGGGPELGETQEECVIREVKEETNLRIRIEQLLCDSQDMVLYLCTPLSRDERIGLELGNVSLLEMGWYPLDDESVWEPGFYGDHIYPHLKIVQQAVSGTEE